MLHLTKQEQLIIVLFMLALIFGAILRLKKTQESFELISGSPAATHQTN